MNKNELEKKFWNWLDSISIKYKNYEIKNAIIANEYGQFNKKVNNNLDYFSIRRLLSFVKWYFIINYGKYFSIKNINRLIIICNFININKIGTKNAYAINFTPSDSRHFLHIGNIVDEDKKAVVFTVKKEVFEHFRDSKIPVVYFNINRYWLNKKNLKIDNKCKYSNQKFRIKINSIGLLLKAASLIDLLEKFTENYELPKSLVTLQDFHAFDSAFASYCKNKIPTVTLQHGKASNAERNNNNLWKYLISDWMICFGINQAKILEHLGIESNRIKQLGTAKYDYFLKYNSRNYGKKYTKKRILFGIQQTSFYNYNTLKELIDFLKPLLGLGKEYRLSFRFHPAIKEKNKRRFIKFLERYYFNNDSINIDISNIADPLRDIKKSKIIFVSKSTFGMEGMLLRKPVIEYFSKKLLSRKYSDYRDFCLHVLNGWEAKKVILKLMNDEDYYKEVVNKQNRSAYKEIMPPPAIPRILSFIDNLKLEKEGGTNLK